MRRGRAGALILGVWGCAGEPPGAAPVETGTPTAETGSPTDTGPDPGERLGRLIRVGTATADRASYAGTEHVRFLADAGAGDVVCDVSFALASVAPRPDCDGCEWAFDLVVSGAAVDVDTDGACATVLGVDAATIGAWNGEPRAYGYEAEYFGHAAVILYVDEVGDWKAGDYASYDPVTGAFAYEWDDGLLAY